MLKYLTLRIGTHSRQAKSQTGEEESKRETNEKWNPRAYFGKPNDLASQLGRVMAPW
jgi:hypothetical protein